MITDPYFYMLAVPALLLMGVSKGAFGQGIGTLSTPLMALAVPAPVAAAITLPILCLMDLTGIWGYRGQWDRSQMRIILPGAAIGVAVGGLLFGILDDHAVGLLIGVLAFVFGLEWWLRRGAERPAAKPHAGKGIFWSALAGFTSCIAHAGGPPIVVYLLPQRLERRVFVATLVLFFTAVNYMKFVPYGILGLFNWQNVMTSLVLAPVAPIGMGLGIWLHEKIPPIPFYRICYSFVLISGAKLIYDNARVLI